ncbi:MAG: DNRLRE domain-containing protein [Bacteroidetes bacterium]|jgi:hypothetical protein|nr:DNRLRE domain-containing protein [Bacteroidota bacterium]
MIRKFFILSLIAICLFAFSSCQKTSHGPVTVTLDPTNNPSEFDVNVLGGQDWSNGTSIEIPLAAWTIGGTPVTMRQLLKFDLSKIPASANIVKANLYLYSDTIPKNGDLVHANYGTNNAIILQQIGSTWDPQSMNWTSQPEGLTDNQIIIPSTDQPFLNLNINVQPMVAQMVNTGQNYGFKMQLQDESIYTSRIFCSSYYADASRHPKLVITYTH